jgi:hypothetical protein
MLGGHLFPNIKLHLQLLVLIQQWQVLTLKLPQSVELVLALLLATGHKTP